MSSEPRPSAWAFRNFRLYTYAAFLLPFAAQAQSLVIGWQVFEIKRDPLYLGFIGLAEAMPALSLALFAGYVVDNSNPLVVYKNVVRLCLFSAAMLFVVTGNWFPIPVDTKLALLYLAAFLAGIARGFRMPAVTALVPRLVPREALHISSAWTTSGFSMASSLGPALGGVLYAWKGAFLPYGLNIALLCACLALLAGIDIAHLRAKSAAITSAWENITAGLRYVFSQELLLIPLTLDMFAVLFGGAVALLPVFAGEILKVGPSGLGVLRAASSVGTLAGSLWMIRFPVRHHSGKILLACVTGFGLCMIGFGLSKIFWLSTLCLFAGGVFDSVSMVIRSATVQLVSPENMRGRVGAVNSIFIGVSNQLGEFESGVMASLLGTAPSVVAGGILTLVVVAVVAAKAPSLRKMHLAKL